MKNRKNKNAITLIALVITIVIMLLLAAVAIQMTMGENGLIAKSKEAQKAQAKAELYDTANLSYTNLKAKALENGQPSPQAELALSTTEFTNKYNVVGDNITDKKGNFIDTKANVLNVLQGTVAGGFSSGTSTGGTSSSESWPKTVGGIPILENDKDKLILKFKAKEETAILEFGATWKEALQNISPVEVDYGNGEKGTITDMYFAERKTYNKGEYILKFKNVRDFGISPIGGDIEILNWGNIQENNEENNIYIYGVSKIYEPEPDRIPIHYIEPLFTEIPEWLFSKKVTSKVMSKFSSEEDMSFESSITTIPEGLFKNCVNGEKFNSVFRGSKITSIPENLFKYNLNITDFSNIFENCKDLTNIPENLFKNNIKVIDFIFVFSGCSGLTSIPEGLFKNNVNVTSFYYTFSGCSGLTSIPDRIIEAAKKVKEKGGNVNGMFYGCTSASNYASIPDYMKY